MIESITQESLLINTESSQLISRYAGNVRLIASHPTSVIIKNPFAKNILDDIYILF